jgi:hypothetical protein
MLPGISKTPKLTIKRATLEKCDAVLMILLLVEWLLCMGIPMFLTTRHEDNG